MAVAPRHATHSAQNLGYALQWPAFAVFGIVVWFRVCRDAVKGPPEAKPVPAPHAPAPEPAAAVVPVTDEEDPELAAYNRYLARLNEDAPSEGVAAVLPGAGVRGRRRADHPGAGRACR